MEIIKLKTYLSDPRFDRFLMAVGGDEERAKRLYLANLAVAQSFHPLLGIFEVFLRNALNIVLVRYWSDPEWILNKRSQFPKAMKTKVVDAESNLVKRGLAVSSGKLIAEQNMSFWTDLFETNHFRELRGCPMKLFPKLPTGIGRQEISQQLNSIRIMRNRINHNEPICFSRAAIDFSATRKVHEDLLNLLKWIDPDLKTWVLEIDRVEEAIVAAEKV